MAKIKINNQGVLDLELQAMFSRRYKKLSKTHNFNSALQVKDDNFPLVITSTGDINPYKFANGNVVKYFKEQVNYKQTIQYLCKELNADAIAVSFSKLTVASVSAFGINGYIRLDTYLYIIDKNGNIIANGYALSKPVASKGKELSDYQIRLDDFSIIFDQMVNKLVTNNK